MKVNVNHPSFVSFLDTVNGNILNNVNVSNYFSLKSNKKISIQYVTLKLVYSSVKVRAKLTDIELLSFVMILLKRNEEIENYEFTSVLNDIVKNFDKINELTKTGLRKTKKIKVDEKKDA